MFFYLSLHCLENNFNSLFHYLAVRIAREIIDLGGSYFNDFFKHKSVCKYGRYQLSEQIAIKI